MIPPLAVRLLRALLALLLGLLTLCGGARAQPAAALSLDDRQDRFDAWTVTRVWADPGGQASLEEAVAQRAQARVHAGPHANLGVQRGAIWLWVPVRVPATSSGRWTLSLDYPALDRIDLHVLSEGTVVSQARMGDTLPRSERPLRTHGHAVRLHLDPGHEHVLLLRVQSTSSLVLPLTLEREDSFDEGEAAHQALQGLMLGIALCLLVYSVAQWISLREAAFCFYALNVLGVGVFFLSQFGLGGQHLWGEHVWLNQNISPLAILTGLCGGLLFIDRVLAAQEQARWVSRALRLFALGTVVVALLRATGVLSYELTGAIATSLGPVPMIFGVPLAWMRARAGDRAARFIFVGWGVYAVGVVEMALLLRGHAPATFWSLHALQFASAVEMVMWMVVLGVRIKSVRRAAELAERERDRLHSLASTDPLTGALNRRGLQAALEPRLALLSQGTSMQLAFYVLDLDGFKPVNDLLGHDAGDELLVGVARRLRQSVRESDLVARVGGDEFVVVVDALHGEAMAERIGQKLLQCFETPFDVEGAPCRVGATIGFALAPVDGVTAAELMRRADGAMYVGKQGGKSQLRRSEAPATASA